MHIITRMCVCMYDSFYVHICWHTLMVVPALVLPAAPKKESLSELKVSVCVAPNMLEHVCIKGSICGDSCIHILT